MRVDRNTGERKPLPVWVKVILIALVMFAIVFAISLMAFVHGLQEL